MPIKAERMLEVIKLANEAVEKLTQARGALKDAEIDAGKARRRLTELDINDEYLGDLIFNIQQQTREARAETEPTPASIQQVAMENAKFIANSYKNKNAAGRMQMLRQGIRRQKFVPRKSTINLDGEAGTRALMEENEKTQPIVETIIPDWEISRRLKNLDGEDAAAEQTDQTQWLPKKKGKKVTKKITTTPAVSTSASPSGEAIAKDETEDEGNG